MTCFNTHSMRKNMFFLYSCMYNMCVRTCFSHLYERTKHDRGETYQLDPANSLVGLVEALYKAYLDNII